MVSFTEFEGATAEEVLSWALSTYGDSLAISTSFQKEGMVVIDMATRINPRARVFTIDTGRLPEETHQMIETVRQRYGIPVEIVFPEAAEVETMIAGARSQPVLPRGGTAQALLPHPQSAAAGAQTGDSERLGGWVAPLADGIAGEYRQGRKPRWHGENQPAGGLEQTGRGRSTSAGTTFRFIRFTPKVFRVSAADLVRAPPSIAKTSARAAGGGSRMPRRNAAFTLRPAAKWCGKSTR